MKKRDGQPGHRGEIPVVGIAQLEGLNGRGERCFVSRVVLSSGG
jgi:hypothetical protein